MAAVELVAGAGETANAHANPVFPNRFSAGPLSDVAKDSGIGACSPAVATHTLNSLV